MDHFLREIAHIENERRVALTSAYPALLPLVLESKRALRSMVYAAHPQFKTARANSTSNSNSTPSQTNDTWFHVTDHSSPLYRKYNKRELDEGKIENINIAIAHLNGLVIPPGKTFSFWKHVGRPSSKRGFKKGLVLANGRLKEDIGGGLCQLSNLIAYMFACTECAFVERKHHSRDVFPDSNRSVPFASGATIFYNLIDLRIKNTYPFPVRLNLRTTDTQLRGSIDIPVTQNYFIKLEERESYFIQSARTKKIYRCNNLSRVFYEKNTRNKIKKEPLWSNVAEVMYDKRDIMQAIVVANG